MSLAEVIACVVSALALGTAVAARRRAPRVVAAATAVTACAVTLALAPARWQLVPLLVGAVVLLLLAIPRSPRRAVRVAAVGLAGLAMVAGGVLMAVMPLGFLPAPTGPHRIGTTVFSVTDDSRDELFLPGSGRHRTLTVQAWYPTDATVGRTEPYLRDPEALSGMLDYVRLPHWVLGYLSAAPTHALTDAPVAPGGRLPVVFALTGNMGYRQSQTVQVEELASHGYVVVGIDQPGTASSALLLDGTRIPYAGRSGLAAAIGQSIDPVATAPILNGVPLPDGLAPYLAADGSAVLDHLITLDAASTGRFAGRLDLTRLGAFGMSLGGYTVSQWCATDHRLKACMPMDAPMTAQAVRLGLEVPTLWLTRPEADMAAEGWSADAIRQYAGTERALYDRTRAPAWYVQVSGLYHADLTDGPYGSTLFNLAGLTRGDGVHAHEVMRGLTLAFFDRALLGLDAPLLDQDQPWPDVQAVRHG